MWVIELILALWIGNRLGKFLALLNRPMNSNIRWSRFQMMKRHFVPKEIQVRRTTWTDSRR